MYRRLHTHTHTHTHTHAAEREGREERGEGMWSEEQLLSLHVTSPPCVKLWSGDTGCLFVLLHILISASSSPSSSAASASSSSVTMSDSEDMTEFASIVERIERGEVSESPPPHTHTSGDDLRFFWQQRSVCQHVPEISSASPACRAVRGRRGEERRGEERRGEERRGEERRGEGGWQTHTSACSILFYSILFYYSNIMYYIYCDIVTWWTEGVFCWMTVCL